MMRKCARAADVLPAKLVREIQRYYEGMLWIPVRLRSSGKRNDNRARDRAIVRDRARGMTVEELAQSYYLTVERIRQILRPAGKQKSVR